MLIKLPRAIGDFFRKQCITSLVFNTSATSYSQYNQKQYLAFLRWFSKNAWFGWSRIITLDGEQWSDKGAVGPGVGTHFFVYKRHFFFFKIMEQESQGSDFSKYKISISVIGRNKQPLYDLMEEFMIKSDRDKNITVYNAKGGEWLWMTETEHRVKTSMIISENVNNELIKPLQEWRDNKQWYVDRGLDYKFCALLYGPPGTGKSSLAREIAFMLKRNLYLLAPDGTVSYQQLFQQAKGGLILMEDIDTYGVTRKRTGDEVDVKRGIIKPIEKKDQVTGKNDIGKEEDKLGEAMAEFMGGNLSDLLNALQGVIPLDDLVILMSTNHPEKLDSALIRDSRVDARVEVGYMCSSDIALYFERAYGVTYEGPSFPSLPAATVSDAFLSNKFNPEGFINKLISNNLEEQACEPFLLKDVANS
ncbi:hypothetical protein pETSU_106 [Edwardsiella phage pEt-SU]|uniref:AAA+ ATPase domain-containing protein n=1 Tax=Edwardsiella phage pEt-SU TaxID=2562142 RepID=A0A4D6DWD6_9CAUD|nr:hypothetical protein HOV39_gp106 [Edwardsiella phage pEt-SU]QBZ70687.1 hypothetical protein pETSU_106 [Edwardsiella phage pEt-SU]